MRAPAVALACFGVLIAASLACSLAGGGGTPTRSLGGTPATTAEVAATPTEAPPSEWLELETPPPEGIIDAMAAKVAAGGWTKEEGLIQSLKLFTGEAQPEQLFPAVPADLEGTGLVAQAMAYVASAPESTTAKEINRLLNIVAPDPEKLLKYSVPAGSASRENGSPGLASPRRAEMPCATLWEDGFPEAEGDPSKPGALCFEYKTATFQGSKIRVFTPVSPDLVWGTKSGYGDAAIQAVEDSLKTFSGLAVGGKPGALGDVDVVFTVLDTPKADALAVTPFTYGSALSCRIVSYPISIQDNENKATSNQDFDVFKQTVAHEMFHCFTAWNYPTHWKAAMKGQYDVLDWWIEGAAEYFSNVVYPKTNDEWFRTKSWEVNSATKSVVDMDYDNFGFFQYLGNVLGNNALLSLLATTPTSGDEAAQEATLAAYPGMETLFNDYARAFMDGTIQDSAGADVFLPTMPVYVLPMYRLDVAAPTKLNLGAPPFVLMRYGLRFQQEREYLLSPVVSGAKGLDASRPRDVPGAWGDLPPSVSATCADVKYYELMTSTTESSPDFSIDLSVDTKEGAACDKCLIGIWDLNKQSFQEYAEAPFSSTPDLYNFLGADGLFRYRFRADGTMRGEFGFSYLYRLTQKNSPLGYDITVDGQLDADGTGDGTYTSDGVNNLGLALVKNGVKLTQQIWMNGQKVDNSSFGQAPSQGLIGPHAVYSCDGDKLLLNFAPESSLPPLQFDRAKGTP